MRHFGKSNGGGRRLARREDAPVLIVYFTMSRSDSATLVNVSRTGARMRGNQLPSIGEELILTIEGIRTYGKVAWVRGRECGVAFDEPMPPGSVQRIRCGAVLTEGLSPELKAAFEDWTLGMAR